MDRTTWCSLSVAALVAGLVGCQPQGVAAAPGTGGAGSDGGHTDTAGAIVANHKSIAAFDSIPTSVIDAVKQKFRIHYTHTSHGSQLVTGMKMLASERGGSYAHEGVFLTEEDGDLGASGDTSWADTTRLLLDKPSSEFNVVFWSWCGGVSETDAAGIDAYLAAVNRLEQDYPAVRFIYMTGHTNEWKVENTRARNQQIREYCAANRKVLYDFEDIESWAPDGTFHEKTGDDCAWCSAWCASHKCPSCEDCAHSQCFNCYLKGKAFWWMMARLSGWNGS